jgi:hypothetical protein
MKHSIIATIAFTALMPLALAVKSPVPPSYGFNKALKFTLNEVSPLLPHLPTSSAFSQSKDSFTSHQLTTPMQDNDIIFGAATELALTGAPGSILGLGGFDLLVDPPVFNHKGHCCRPTPQCHAYFRWVIDVLNSESKWDNDAQRDEAMGHMDCCIRQYRASCENPQMGHEIFWKDPAKSCSNKPTELPDGLRLGGADEKEEKEKDKEEKPHVEVIPGGPALEGATPVLPEEMPPIEDAAKVEEEPKVEEARKVEEAPKVEEEPKAEDDAHGKQEQKSEQAPEAKTPSDDNGSSLPRIQGLHESWPPGYPRIPWTAPWWPSSKPPRARRSWLRRRRE